MKNITFIALVAVLLTFQSCASQVYMDKTTIDRVVSDGQFTFMAQKANPVNYDVVNIANSMPNYGSNRMFNLDYGYSLQLKESEIVSVLPYFGRSYRATGYDTDKQGLRFESKDFSITRSVSKKGNHIITVRPNDVNHIDRLVIEVYKNGKALLSVDANDRQPISFDGYLMKNEAAKK